MRMIFALLTLLTLPMVAVLSSAAAQQDESILPPQDAPQLQIQTMLIHPALVTEAEFSPAGEVFITGALDETLRIWEAADAPLGELLYTFEGYFPGVTLTAFDSRERFMAANLGEGNQISVVDLRDGDIVSELDGHELPISSMAFLDGDNRLLSRDFLDTVIIWDVEAATPLLEIEGVLAYAIDSEGETVALVDDDGLVTLYPATDLEDATTLDTEADNVRFSPGGRYLTSWGADVSVWDALNGEALFTIEDAGADEVIWSPDGRFIIVRTFGGGTVYAVSESETATPGQEIDSFIRLEAGIVDMQFTPDGGRVVTVDQEGVMRLWRFLPDGSVDQVRGLQGITDSFIISPDSRTLVGFQLDFRTRFYDAQSGGLWESLRLPESLHFSPNWRLLSSYSANVVTWRTLPTDDLTFANPPIGRPARFTFLRLTPSEEYASIQRIDAPQPIFAIGRNAAGDWLRVLLEDGTQGWLRTDSLSLDAEVESLPIIQIGRLRDGDSPIALSAEAGGEAGAQTCPQGWLVSLLERERVGGESYVQVECGGAIGWVAESELAE